MVDFGTFGSLGSQLFSRLVSGGIIIVGIIILAAVIVAVAFYVRYASQFIYEVEIRSLRSSGVKGTPTYKILKDKGAFIRKKKDKTTWFRLRNQAVDLPSPPLECIQLGIKGKNYIKILQLSDEEYYYLMPESIDTATIIRDGKPIILGQETVKVLDGDVAYWNIQKKKDNKKLFDMESLLMKVLPYVGIMLMFMCVVFLSYFMTNHWGEFSAAAQALEKAADRLASISGGTITPAG